MTPKEKAFELVKIFQPHTDVHRIPIYHAKKCALIAVDEILEAQPSRRYWDTYYDETPSALIYWQEVKQEIEKI